MDFNPLDILAAAAVLQRDDPNAVDEPGTTTATDAGDCNDTATEEATEDESSNKSDKMGSARKVRSEIKRQNSCNLPSTMGMLFNGSSEVEGGVDTSVSEDEIRRTLRRHSWSADTVAEGQSGDASKNISSIENGDLNLDSCSAKDKNVESDSGESKDDLETARSPLKTENDASNGSDSKISSAISDAHLSDTEDTCADNELDGKSGAAACCPVCHKTKAEIANGHLNDDVLCALCEQQTLESQSSVSPEWLEHNSKPKNRLCLESYQSCDSEETGKGDLNVTDNKQSVAMETGNSHSLDNSLDNSDCDVKLDTPEERLIFRVQFDHCYASQPGKTLDRVSLDSYDTENGGESDSCGENSYTEEVEHRARSMSMESECLRCGYSDKHFSLPVKGQEDCEASILSPTSSVDSSLMDFPTLKLSNVPVHNKSIEPEVQQHATQGYSDGCDDTLSSPTSSVDSLQGQIPSKVGKFRIGTFASFSSSNIDSESPLTDHKGFKLNVSKEHSTSSSPYFDKGLMGSPPMNVPESPGIPSFLQSPCGDWDRSDAGSEVQDELGPPHCSDTSSELKNMLLGIHSHHSSIDHDHDYCLREGQLTGQFVQDSLKSERRKHSSWTKAKSGIVRHIKDPKFKSKVKVKKAKVEFFDGPSVSTPEEEVEHFKQPFEVDFSSDRTHPGISRTSRRRLEKLQEQLDLDNGSKLKITGKFKDDYVYYLNKSSRSRRRASTNLPPPPPTDKIILPAPKPGDIIVPHLTDADIEAIKLRGKAGLSIGEKYYGAGLSSALHRSQSSPDSLHQSEVKHIPVSTASEAPPEAAATEIITDVDSKIISTILSMENDNLGSPASTHDSSLSESVDLYSPSEDSVGINFMGENMTLTPDQVNMLLDAVKDVETTPEEIIKSGGEVKYGLDNNQNYDNSVENTELSANQKSFDEDTSTSDEMERRPSVSSAASDLETDTKENYNWIKIEPAEVPSSSSHSVSLPQDSVSVSSSVTTSSTESAPPAVNPNASPGKVLLESDLHTISDGTPLRDLMPTIDKPFDLLENDFRLDKSDLFPEAAVSDANTVSTSGVSDYNTPWIVTVTMYWNDLPAIMIDNQPFVRLVDIHKQILPAKDTGILKKRCQLLGVEVLNCSEMQRYFLVQYGRAYNSKSTLIVSKDNAKNLIGYYVNPQPRVLKPDELLRRDDFEGDGTTVTHQFGDGHLVKPSTAYVPRKKVRRRDYPRIPTAPKVEVVSSPELAVQERVVGLPVPIAEVKTEPGLIQVSKRLRHKKINFLELLKGEANVDSSSPGDETEKKLDDEDADNINNKKASSPLSAIGKKKSKLSDAEKLKLAKEELKKRKIELVEEADQQKKASKIIEQDSEEENHSSSANRRRYRTSKSKKVPTLSRSRSRLKKVGPLKVKIKGLLNFKKGSKRNSSSDNKVIEIRHKDPKPTNTHPSVTQDGDVHLDLYQKKSSLCIKCCSCKKFLSLRNFLTHQHYPDDFEILTTVAQPQILEPRSNKLSDKKKGLWQEFNRRRKELEGTKPVNQHKPAILLEPPLPSMKKSVISTSPVVHQPSKPQVVSVKASPDVETSRYKPGSELEAELRKKIEVPQFKQPLTMKISPPNPCASSGVRASSRKRKERQLFPIENYSFAKKMARLDLPGEDNASVTSTESSVTTGQKDLAASAVVSNSVLTLSNGPELTNFTALENGPEV